MRALVQRVSSARVEALGRTVGEIGPGLLVYLGFAATDTQQSIRPLAEKLVNLRIFEDADGKMNLSVRDVGGTILAVSNFTLMADVRKGRRPSFVAAASGVNARPLYEAFLAELASLGCEAARGAFGEHMDIQSVADGPVNLVVEFPPAGPP